MPGLLNPSLAASGAGAGAASPAGPPPSAGGYNFGTALPWSSGGASMDFTGNPASLAASYGSAYNAALGFNQANYNNIMGGFQNVLGQLAPAQSGIASGYNALSGAVQGQIGDIGQSQAQAIRDQYAATQGNATQDLISRGLGNSTVVSSVQRGIGLDQAKAQNDLANQIAQTKAGYMSSLGMAGLQFQAQAAAMQAQIQQNQLGAMERVNAQYPNAALYGQLAQMFGANQANQDALKRYGGFQMQQAGGPGGGGGGSMGYVPSGGSLPGPTPGSFGGGSNLSYAPTGLGYNPALTPGFSYGSAAASGPVAPGYDKGFGFGDPGAGKGFSGEDNALAGVIGYAPANYAQPEEDFGFYE